jgi:hypothetical protein
MYYYAPSEICPVRVQDYKTHLVLDDWLFVPGGKRKLVRQREI